VQLSKYNCPIELWTTAQCSNNSLFLFRTFVLDKAFNQETVCGELLHVTKGHKVL